MTIDPLPDDHQGLLRRIDRNLEVPGMAPDETAARRTERQRYFRELFRLQGELVKLPDGVAHTRHEVAILFEGRDAAGKAGLIKRITQRLNPRAGRVAALPARTRRGSAE
jgi:polyphosphate kinase 2 (PPK2 family)